MSETNERSVASTGSVGEPRDGALSGCETVRSATQPVAWAALRNGSVEQVAVHPVYLSCDIHRVAPLYLAPALTDAEREAVAYYVGTGGPDAIDATLRGLLDRLSPIAKGDNDRPEAIASDYPDQDNAPKQDTTPAQGSVPPEWMARPFWVDPPAGHRYGFPKLYDPATDGDMTAWMVANGYPQHLADKGLACTFTATD